MPNHHPPMELTPLELEAPLLPNLIQVRTPYGLRQCLAEVPLDEKLGVGMFGTNQDICVLAISSRLNTWFMLGTQNLHSYGEVLRTRSPLIYFNALHTLKELGLTLHEMVPGFCISTAIQIINSKSCRVPYPLYTVVQELLGYELLPRTNPFEEDSPGLSLELLFYASRYTSLLLDLEEVLRERLRTERLERVMQLELELIPIVSLMNRTGIPFNPELWRDQIAETERELEELEAQCPPPFQGVDLNDTNAVNAALEQHGQTTIQSDETAWLSRVRQLRSSLNNYGHQYLANDDPQSGRLYPTWVPIGTATGRIVCREPSIQSLPRETRYRRCVRASEGYTLLSGDWSHIDLRVVAELSNDARLLELFHRGEDPYHQIASQIVGSTTETVTSEQRQLAKAVCLGMIFGLKAKGLRKYVRHNFNIQFSLDEAEEYQRRFWSEYSGLVEWQEQTIEVGRSVMNSHTALGRRRWFSSIDKPLEPKFLNNPVQATAADGLKSALVLLYRAIQEFGDDVRLLMVLHDEIMLEVRDGLVGQIAPILVQCMKDGMALYIHEVPIQVKLMQGDNWGELQIVTENP